MRYKDTKKPKEMLERERKRGKREDVSREELNVHIHSRGTHIVFSTLHVCIRFSWRSEVRETTSKRKRYVHVRMYLSFLICGENERSLFNIYEVGMLAVVKF